MVEPAYVDEGGGEEAQGGDEAISVTKVGCCGHVPLGRKLLCQVLHGALHLVASLDLGQ